ncbi:hypothetical protein MW887_000690 [Aspergillus wentii]|nr:hypothetical protein MW887_000690 [Aspergillus wentii]
MPALTLHLLTLHPHTTPKTFLNQLRQTVQVIVSSRPRYTVIHPTTIDADPLATEQWDLLVLRENKPLPSDLQKQIRTEYKLTVGVPSKLLSTYEQRDAELKHTPPPPLTGSLDKARENGKSSSQNLELSPDLLAFMDELTQHHPGPVTMLNLLHFHPNGKQSYFNYGQAFIPVAGKRGGSAKLVGNVVKPKAGHEAETESDSRGSIDRPESEWWNEISIVHYPSIRHFCDMLAGEDYQAINERHRLSVSYP